MTKTFGDIVEALRVSVLEQTAAGGEDLTERLTKNFTRFEEELDAGLDAALPRQAATVDPIEHFALGLDQLEAVAEEIAGGVCLKIADMAPSDNALVLVKATLDLGRMALRAMASEFAAPVAEGEQPGDEETLVKVATSAGEALVKTVLPREAAGLLVDPVDLADELVAFGGELMLLGGIAPEQLAKAFPKAKEEDEEDEDDRQDPPEPREAGGADDQDPDADVDPEDADAAGEGDDDDAGEIDGTPFENISRLATGILLEIDAIEGEIADMGGDVDGEGNQVVDAVRGMARQAALIAVQSDALQAAVDGENPEEADEAAMKAIQAGALAKAAGQALPIVVAADGALAKRASEAEEAVASARSDLAQANARIAELEKLPGAPKGLAKTVAVSKAADNGGEEDETIDQKAERLAALPEAQRHLEMMKFALSRPLGSR